MSTATLDNPKAAMPRPKPKMEVETTKVDRELLDKARVAFNYVKAKDKDLRAYTLAAYLSDCLRGKRNLLDDHAAYIREEAKKLK